MACGQQYEAPERQWKCFSLLLLRHHHQQQHTATASCCHYGPFSLSPLSTPSIEAISPHSLHTVYPTCPYLPFIPNASSFFSPASFLCNLPQCNFLNRSLRLFGQSSNSGQDRTCLTANRHTSCCSRRMTAIRHSLQRFSSPH
jgi:hypothetical protein